MSACVGMEETSGGGIVAGIVVVGGICVGVRDSPGEGVGRELMLEEKVVLQHYNQLEKQQI